MKYENPRAWFHELATHYLVAQVIFHLSQTGVIQELDIAESVDVKDLSQKLSLDERVLSIVLEYAAGTDPVIEKIGEGRYRLTDFGREVARQFCRKDSEGRKYNLFDVRIGALGNVWQNLSGLLKGDLVYGKNIVRNGAYAADGVYKLAAGNFPSLENAVRDFSPSAVVEFGPTSGLMQLLAGKFPDLRLYGIDRKQESLDEAERYARNAGVSNIKWIRSDMYDIGAWSPNLVTEKNVIFFSVHFHEFLSAGENRFREFLAEMAGEFKGSRIIVMDIPAIAPDVKESVPPSLWQFSAYNIISHHLIGTGRILTEDQWKNLLQIPQAKLIRVEPSGSFGYVSFHLDLANERF